MFCNPTDEPSYDSKHYKNRPERFPKNVILITHHNDTITSNYYELIIFNRYKINLTKTI